jgi:hypothetical protein
MFLADPCSQGLADTDSQGRCRASSGTQAALWSATIGSGILLVGSLNATILGWNAFAKSNGPNIEVMPVGPRAGGAMASLGRVRGGWGSVGAFYAVFTASQSTRICCRIGGSPEG